jgi:D-alanyl-lipoteichoic acid acyltransferase DltB (MBOAT superfamily)
VFYRSNKAQNVLLLLASYIFYGWMDWRFVAFLIAVSGLNFYLGIAIEKATNLKKRRWLLGVGLFQGIGGLVFFKYYNFFITSFNDAFGWFHIALDLPTLQLLIPLGISFFTFRTLSYLLDIDKGKISATTNGLVFFNYVAFFPTVLSGPIDKAKTFIPQLENRRTFNAYLSADGLRQLLWGVFKKAVIADNCATITNQIFNNYYTFPASSLVIGAFLYTVQIYTDFSGYSDMAIGFSKLIGFRVTKNFDYPYFAQNSADFWRRWHMSLTSWLTEYVFAPLSISFRDYNQLGLIVAIVINFTICGIWHGANWTYVLFGFLHGCYFIPLILKGTMNKKKKFAKEKLLPTFSEFFNIIKTFLLVMFTFVIFRANTIKEAYLYYRSMVSVSLFSAPKIPTEGVMLFPLILFITLFFVIEWIGKDQEYALAQLASNRSTTVRWTCYFALFLALFYFAGSEQKFIYFNF